MTSLGELPPELYNLFVDHLDLADIKNMRLVSRDVADKATQDRFHSFYKSKHLDITKRNLEDFVWIVSNSALAKKLEDLSLVALVPNTVRLKDIIITRKRPTPLMIETNWDEDDGDEEELENCSDEALSKVMDDFIVLSEWQDDGDRLRKNGRDVCLLSRALSGLAADGVSLRSLSTSVVTYQYDTTTRLFPVEVKCRLWVQEAAAHTFSMAMKSLRHSGLRVECLHFFCLDQACGVAHDTLSQFNWTQPKAFHLAALRVLSLRLTDQVIFESAYATRNGGDHSRTDSRHLTDETRHPLPTLEELEENARQSTIALTRMLEACSNLEVLELAKYNLSYKSAELNIATMRSRPRYMDSLALMRPMKTLRSLHLAGFCTDEDQLAAFLRAHGPVLEDLRLRNIRLVQGSWRRTLSVLTEAAFSLDSLHLEDLSDNDGHVMCFSNNQEDSECTEVEDGHIEGNDIYRWGADTWQPITFREDRELDYDDDDVQLWSRAIANSDPSTSQRKTPQKFRRKSMSQAGPALSPSAIIVICILIAGALVLCSWALFRHLCSDRDDENFGLDRAAPDMRERFSQAQYMRLVRLKAKEDLMGRSGARREKGMGSGD
ncbi:unnamed protein product [Zymoseptoria tritici ST99CH_1A5]|nr:unnamed protein product [Zymoseptoria tritici ST99CH_1A5]